MIRRSWTQAASIEETLALWAASLREMKERIRPLFSQKRVAANAGLFLEGLLGDEQRKTGWMRAEAAGDPGPWRQQAILGRGRWNADALRENLKLRLLNARLALLSRQFDTAQADLREALTVMVYVLGTKFATRSRFAVAVKV